MSSKHEATMASRLRDEIKPRRFDLTMSRRTRRPAAATSDHLQSRQPELDAHQEHETPSEQSSEDTTKEQQASPPQTCRLQQKDDESMAQQQQQQEEDEECQDNSRRFSLQELIEDDAVDGGVKDAAAGGAEENASAGGVREVAEGAAASGAEKRPGQQEPGRRVIGIMRRYVKVRSIRPKRASPAKNATPVC